MTIKTAQADLPRGLRGAADVWDQPQASVILDEDYFEAAASGATGTLAATEAGSDTTSVAGVVRVAGSLTVTEAGSDALASTGSVRVSGALNAAESGSDTFAATGSVSTSAGITGSMSAAEAGSDSFSSSGAVQVRGALTATEGGSDVLAATGSIRIVGLMAATEEGSDTAQFLSGEAPPAPVAGGGGFVMMGRPSRLWWARKPKVMDDEEADQKVERVVKVIERAAQAQVSRNVTQPNKVARAEVRQQIEPLVQEMPGFDWGTVYRTLLIQAAAQRQMLLAEQEAQRLQRQAEDEDDLIVLLMG